MYNIATFPIAFVTRRSLQNLRKRSTDLVGRCHGKLHHRLRLGQTLIFQEHVKANRLFSKERKKPVVKERSGVIYQ